MCNQTDDAAFHYSFVFLFNRLFSYSSYINDDTEISYHLIKQILTWDNLIH